MPRTVLIPLRLPAELLDQADALLPRIAADPEVTAVGRITRSSVLRMAMAHGLKSMAWKYAPEPEAKKGRRR